MVVYILTNMVNGKHYVGWTTKTLDKRWRRHVSDSNAPSRKRHCHHLNAAIRKYGPAAFMRHILCRPDTEARAKNLERVFIYALRSNDPKIGYNLTGGGEGYLGLVVTPEHRAAISAANLGRKHTPEERARMSAANKGRKLSLETRLKRSLAQTGKPGRKGAHFSIEARARMSASKLGRPHPHVGRPRPLKRGAPWSKARRSAYEARWGSGTTGAVTQELGRSFVGLDLAYHDLAKARIERGTRPPKTSKKRKTVV